jgi:hypothetical protein
MESFFIKKCQFLQHETATKGSSFRVDKNGVCYKKLAMYSWTRAPKERIDEVNSS